MSARPLRVAIVGAGPSGFYTAEFLLQQAAMPVTVDMFDRLPTPFGLVRAGVAPDHPKIKTITRLFDKTAARPGFRFFGNVEIGTDITVAELTAWYDAVVYAAGADRGKLCPVPGNDLDGNYTASDFVGWYNGSPYRRSLSVDLACERAVVIGNGNVALDIARILAKPACELAVTDMADHALAALAASNIREVVVLGRRGPTEAAFTNTELVELGELTDVDVVVESTELGSLDEPVEAMARLNVGTLRGFADGRRTGGARTITLKFRSAPVAIQGIDQVTGIEVARTELREVGGQICAVATDKTELIEAGLVIHAVGYRATPLPSLPFDTGRGTIVNRAGRVEGPDGPITGQYTAGWIKRGPNGVIGTNKLCAKETATAVIQDAQSGILGWHSPQALPGEHIAEIVAGRVDNIVDFRGWNAIDAAERLRGTASGRPRVKFTRISEMLRAASEESA